MRHLSLGSTGLFVSELCLGTMTFGTNPGAWASMGGLEQQDADRLVGQALDAGINFLDTADVYADGVSEKMTGQALKNLKIPREDVIIATKVFGSMGTGVNSRGATRHHIQDGVKASLKRLQTDHIDLYQIHGFDPATPIEETVRALDNLVEHGHVRYVGVSNWAAWHIATALGIADRWGLARPISVQAYYSVAGRDLEREIIPMLRATGVGLLVWSPLAGGLLSGKYAESKDAGRRAAVDFPPVDADRTKTCIETMRPIAAAHSCSIAAIALAWLLHQPQVTSVIVGAKRPEQLAENISSTHISLNSEELKSIGDVSRLPPEYPGWMFDLQGAQRSEQLAQGRR